MFVSEPPASFIWFSLVLALWKTFSNLFLFTFLPFMTSQMCMLPALDVLFSDLKSSHGVVALHMDVVSWFQSPLPLFSSFLVPLKPFWGERADLAQNIWNVSTLWIYILVLWCFLGFILVFLVVFFPLLLVTEQWADAAVVYLPQLPSSCVKSNSHDTFLFFSCHVLKL